MDLKEILPEFQRFLRDRRLAAEKNIPYHALCVSRFLRSLREDRTMSEKPWLTSSWRAHSPADLHACAEQAWAFGPKPGRFLMCVGEGHCRRRSLRSRH
jgi:hypothetical protein